MKKSTWSWFLSNYLLFRISIILLRCDRGSRLSCDNQFWRVGQISTCSLTFIFSNWRICELLLGPILFKITTTYKSSTNWNNMQSNLFYYVVVHDFYYHYSMEVGIMLLWACVGENSFTIECFLKIDIESIYASNTKQWWWGS